MANARTEEHGAVGVVLAGAKRQVAWLAGSLPLSR